ncbi:MAG: hypothetical protein M3O36_18695 [Myxococcota bacterium]|nr:hypothetical protein [Myxococcota bacterium]
MSSMRARNVSAAEPAASSSRADATRRDEHRRQGRRHDRRPRHDDVPGIPAQAIDLKASIYRGEFLEDFYAMGAAHYSGLTMTNVAVNGTPLTPPASVP